jgi:hypothetical protein
MRADRYKWHELVIIYLMMLPIISQAGEVEEMKREMEDLKERVRQIEGQQVEVRDIKGHRLHPIRGLFKTTISGGFTGIVQGSINNEERFGGERSEGSMSTDLFIEAPVNEHGVVLLRFDVVQGEGLASMPSLFTNANGNTTGPNNDIEGFNEPRLNINEARYEHASYNDSLRIILGQIDLTSWFDENNLANDETMHYLAQQFDNNPTIEWGGSENFFGPGLILVLAPLETVSTSIGWFEGNGNYEKIFRQPFLIGQVSLKTNWAAKEGNYRFYGWGRLTPHCNSGSDASIFLSCELVPSADQIRIKESNAGFGISLDQQISESIGIWARFGYQDPDVSQFDKAIVAGTVLSNGIPGRSNDAIGIAYGAVFPSNAYESATGFSDVEHYAEIYYKYVFYGDGETHGLHITPDVQIIANPGGNGMIDPVYVWGIRTQVNF